jgi:hypothetical protein
MDAYTGDSDYRFWKSAKNDRIKPEPVIGMGQNMQKIAAEPNLPQMGDV